MSDCTNKEIGKLLYSYQLGLLSEAEADAFEVHLLECPACLERHRKDSEVTSLIEHDPEIRALIESQSRDAVEDAAGAAADRSQKRPRRSLLFRTIAVAACLALVLILRP